MTFLESYFQDNNSSAQSWGLGIDSSSHVGRLCFFNKTGLLKEVSWGKERRHSESLLLDFKENIDLLNLDINHLKFIFIGIGPGSFTGIRVSCAFIKSLSFTSKAKILAFPSLRLLAFKKSSDSDSFIVASPSIGDLVFHSKYFKVNGLFQEEICYKTLSIKSLADDAKSPIYLDSSAEHLQKNLTQSLNFFDSKKISLFQSLVFSYNNQLKLCSSSHLDLMPLYLRLSEAEEKFKV